MESTTIFTDTHTHLYSEEFEQDRGEMIQRAINAGVSRFFIPAIDSTCTQAMYDLEQDFPENVFLMKSKFLYSVNLFIFSEFEFLCVIFYKSANIMNFKGKNCEEF